MPDEVFGTNEDDVKLNGIGQTDFQGEPISMDARASTFVPLSCESGEALSSYTLSEHWNTDVVDPEESLPPSMYTKLPQRAAE